MHEIKEFQFVFNDSPQGEKWGYNKKYSIKAYLDLKLKKHKYHLTANF